MPDFRTAIATDVTLLNMVMELTQADMDRLLSPSFQLENRLHDVMYQWAKVRGQSPAGRGGSLSDDRKASFVEKLYDIKQPADPAWVAKKSLWYEKVYLTRFNDNMGRLLQGTAIGPLLRVTQINRRTGETRTYPALNRRVLNDIRMTITITSDPLGAWRNVVRMLQSWGDLRTYPYGANAMDAAILTTTPGHNLNSVLSSLNTVPAPAPR